MNMTKLILTLFLAVLALGAAEVSGRWQGKVLVEGGDELPVNLELQQRDAAVTGTIGNEDNSLMLRDGKLAGDALTFVVVYRGQDFRFELKISDARLTGTVRGKTENGDPVNGKADFAKSK